ncbi:GntR family transcriptional regulator [Desertibacillus haloalkaliphilus]|uniref:GntR family transcriptional regulator n=1 Tax=Desertibacillus haloalkaliphilus TaxID=1328930 RepID=UPI001C2657D6|nr:GntR family transcriptional regulator [Desertibacillus haloalkaliphilus]MBU8907609.1 GntR family transcriptional regulator [Desertibacillus haloalkaliphilus]
MGVIRSEPLYDLVYNHIKNDIFTQAFDPKKRLNEAQLARRLDVSRGPVREAIRRLEQEGLIVSNSKNQLFVYQPTAEDIEHIYQCRGALESLASELAAEKITDAQIKELETIIKQKKQLLASKQPLAEEMVKEFVELSDRFHMIIIEASGNPRLKQQITQLKTLTFYYRYYNTKREQRREEIFTDHLEIFQAIQARDASMAGQLMKIHIGSDREYLVSIFNSEHD